MGIIPVEKQVRHDLHSPNIRMAIPPPIRGNLLLFIVPEQMQFKNTITNPALSPRKINIPSPFNKETTAFITTTRGLGPERIYFDIQSQPPNVAYPPRPIPGSVADLDIVMEHCDFSKKKVRLNTLLVCSASILVLVCSGLLGSLTCRRRTG